MDGSSGVEGVYLDLGCCSATSTYCENRAPAVTRLTEGSPGYGSEVVTILCCADVHKVWLRWSESRPRRELEFGTFWAVDSSRVLPLRDG